MVTANTSPIHLTFPLPFAALNSTANTNRDGTGTIATMVTAVNPGAILAVRFHHQGASGSTPTSMVIRTWYKKAGGSFMLWRELLLPGGTPISQVALGPTVALAAADLPELGAGDAFGFSQPFAEAIVGAGLYREYA